MKDSVNNEPLKLYGMSEEKFQVEIETLKKLLEIYCKDKHNNQERIKKTITYKSLSIDMELTFCKECEVQYEYSVQKLQNCPHIKKPRCRKCPNPCYEKPQWKKLAKIMRYSGTKLKLIKIKNFFPF